MEKSPTGLCFPTFLVKDMFLYVNNPSKTDLSVTNKRLRLKTRISVPPPGFGKIAYWSRGFWYNRSRLLVGQERTATTSCKLLPLLLLEDCLRCFNETEDLHQNFLSSKMEKNKVARNCLKSKMIFDQINFV